MNTKPTQRLEGTLPPRRSTSVNSSMTCPQAVRSLRLNSNSGIHTECFSTRSCKLAVTANPFPPRKLVNCIRDGQRITHLRGLWGDVRVRSQVYQRRNGTHFQQPLDASVDRSGWTPLALEQLIDLTARFPFMEASELALRWGVSVGHAELERLTSLIAATLQKGVETKLQKAALEPLGRLAQRLSTNCPEAQVANACKTPLFLLVLLEKG